MLAGRSIRFFASHCRPAPLFTWSLKTQDAPLALKTTTTWYVPRPPMTAMTAAYSKDAKNGFTSSNLNPMRWSSSTVPETVQKTETNTTIQSSNSVPPQSPKSLIEPSSFKHSASSSPASSSCPPPSSSPPSSSTAADQCSNIFSSDSRIQPPDIKLPNRDQVEKYFFTALVYVWDFCYYVFCLTLKLVDTYILKNPTLQQYWKKLTDRLEQQRQAIKSKK